MTELLAIVVALGLLVGLAVFRLRRLPGKTKKKLFRKTTRAFYQRLEDVGLVARTPGYLPNYHRLYPELEALEKNHPVVRRECLQLLDRKQDLTDMREMGGYYTQAGIHVIRWKTFMFKSGGFIEENCRLAPETAKLLREIPGLYTAFFSVLDPRQYITPHRGYYKGFLRYHLGVVIPNDNEDRSCWLRVNDDRVANAGKDKSVVSQGEKYYWRNGEGVVFDDTYLHDAANESDEVRVVLWLDILKKLPWYLHLPNVFFLWLAHRDGTVRKIRRNALIEG